MKVLMTADTLGGAWFISLVEEVRVERGCCARVLQHNAPRREPVALAHPSRHRVQARAERQHVVEGWGSG